MDKSKGYREILTVLNKYAGLLEEDYSLDIRGRLESRIKLEVISNKFSIKLSSNSDVDWIKISEFSSIAYYGPNNNRRTIAWEDEDRQPKDEQLYSIYFSTGAYIFGDSYPTTTFNKFFQELKSFEPKYVDSKNKSLYYTADKAKAIHEAFNGIFDKYKGMVAEELKVKRIEALQRELEELSDKET